MSQKVLYKEKKQCSGCGACLNICPKQAISMVEDEYGFLYPKVDDTLCIDCGMCIKVCDFQNNVVEAHEPFEVYAASALDTTLIMNSSSGGIFALIAQQVLKMGGVIYGAAYVDNGGNISVENIRVDKLSDLHKLQGSKYVQSVIGRSYSSVKTDLNANKIVLFSGTPCQIAGLRGFLRREYSNLYLIDIVCHGVPSAKMFKSMINYYEENLNGHIVDFSFREKKRGWSDYFARIDIEVNNKLKSKYVHCKNIAYYEYFLHSDIHRENCYECKYACQKRVGDITLGDYWGIEQSHADILADKEWNECLKKGISCVLINSLKGKELMNSIKKLALLEESSFDAASKGNGQLRESSPKSKFRDELLSTWFENDYEKIQTEYKRRMGWNYYYIKIRKTIAPVLKSFLYRR